MTEDDRGVWVAFHSDWSGFSVFISEIDCLRHAVENSMSAKKVPYGVDVRQYVEGR